MKFVQIFKPQLFETDQNQIASTNYNFDDGGNIVNTAATTNDVIQYIAVQKKIANHSTQVETSNFSGIRHLWTSVLPN